MISIDRFEGNYAICQLEDETTFAILQRLLPKGAKEGDLLSPTSFGYALEPQATENKRQENADRLAMLLNRKR